MDPQLLKWCNNSVGYEQFSKLTGSGTKQFETSVDVKCLLIGKLNTIYLANGQLVTTNYIMYIDYEKTPLLNSNDRFIVHNKAVPVGKMECFYTPEGKPDFWEVYL